MSSQKNAEEYDVGYGKPPRDTRFKKGRSGNPKGRPRGSKGLSASLLEPLSRKVQITEGGRTRKVTQLEAFMLLQTKMALNGDPAAANRLIRMLPILMKIAEAEALRENVEDNPSKEAEITQSDQDILRHFAELAQTGEFAFDMESADV